MNLDLFLSSINSRSERSAAPAKNTQTCEPRVFWFLHVHSGGALRMTVRTLAAKMWNMPGLCGEIEGRLGKKRDTPLISLGILGGTSQMVIEYHTSKQSTV